MLPNFFRPSYVVGRLWDGLRLAYSDLNPSTLTGAIDVIVVKQEDGTHSCGPFHVCFGKMGALLPTDLKVDIYINGEYVEDLQMRLGSAGEAFFVEEVDENEEVNPSEVYTPCLAQRALSLENINTAMFNQIVVSTPHDVRVNSIGPASSNDQELKRPRVRCRSLDGINNDREDDPEGNASFLHSSQIPDIEITSCASTAGESPNTPPLYSCLSDSVLNVTDDNTNNVKNLTWDWGTFPFEIAPPQETLQLSDQTSLLHINTSPDVKSPEKVTSPTLPDKIPLNKEIFLDDLIEAQNNDLKDAYIYSESHRTRSLVSPSSWAGSMEGLCNHDAGYRSDGEQSVSPVFPTIINMKLSLCGGLTKESVPTLDQFYKDFVPHDEFVKHSEKILADTNLVVLFNDRFLPWSAVVPQLVSILSYNKELPPTVVKTLEDQHIPHARRSRKAWFSWGTKSTLAAEKDMVKKDELTLSVASETTLQVKASPTASPVEATESIASPSDVSPAAVASVYGKKKRFKKVNRLSHEKIMKLNLQPGYNEIEYRVITRWQGTARCKAAIFLWNWYDKLVISDVDGTITRSDILGHVFPLLGISSWTQVGIVKLYNMIAQNGYRFVYLSARAIGQSELTRRYLSTVLQEGKMQLPKGPILLSPNSLLFALHREVIEKRPEVFKIQCLEDVQHLFPTINNPFFSGFGNRPSDVKTYRTIGIPDCRVFTVDHEGKIYHEGMSSSKTNFVQLTEWVDFIFPARKDAASALESGDNFLEYSDFSYWRTPVHSIESGMVDSALVKPSK